jgi:Tol biopolymer transport system component
LFNPPAIAIEMKSGSDPGESSNFVISPDKRWAAFMSSEFSTKHIWVRPLTGPGTALLLTGGDCNIFDPAWELDSRRIIFASDCGRGIGLPALYRARIGPLIGVYEFSQGF